MIVHGTLKTKWSAYALDSTLSTGSGARKMRTCMVRGDSTQKNGLKKCSRISKPKASQWGIVVVGKSNPFDYFSNYALWCGEGSFSDSKEIFVAIIEGYHFSELKSCLWFEKCSNKEVFQCVR